MKVLESLQNPEKENYQMNQKKIKPKNLIKEIKGSVYLKKESESLTDLFFYLEEKRKATFEKLEEGICEKHGRKLELICQEHKVSQNLS